MLIGGDKMEKKSWIAKVNENGYREVEAQVPEEEKLGFRKNFAQKAIDTWLLAESSDGYKQIQERKLILDFIKLLFLPDSLFPSSEYSETTQQNILLELVTQKKEPPILKEITEFLKKYPSLKKAFLYDICQIIYLDGRVLTSENQFLNDFINLTNISQSEKFEVLRHFKLK